MYDQRDARAGHDASEPLPPGWNRARPERVPRPTYWPVVVALSLTLIFWGAVSALAISVAGLVLLTISLAGWIGELRHVE